MKPKRIILVRHGHSEANHNKEILRIKPDYACELTQLGHQQADQVGRELRHIIPRTETVKYYVSPYWRTRQTYLHMRYHVPENFPMREDPRLREQEWGTKFTTEDDREFEAERDGYGHFYYRIDGGESCADVYDRMSDFIGSMFRDFEHHNPGPDNVIFANHGMGVRVFLMRFLKLSVEEFEICRNLKNCEYHILELQDNGKYKLITKLEPYPHYNHPFQFDWNQQVWVNNGYKS